MSAARARPLLQRRQPIPPEELVRRHFASVLRWRAHWLLPRVAPQLSVAARVVPVLLQASFNHPLLRKEAPGVGDQPRYRRAWSSWSRKVGLLPPQSMQRARGLLSGVVALQRQFGLELLLFPAVELRALDRTRVMDRVAAIRQILGGSAPQLQLRLVEGPLEELDRHACVLFGALLAGALPPELLAEGDPITVPPALVLQAPAGLAQVAMLLLCGHLASSPAAGLAAALRDGRSARVLADPGIGCARWAQRAVARSEELGRLLEWLFPEPGAPTQEPDAKALLETGRALALACTAAVRRLPRLEATDLRAQVRRDLLGPGLPRLLLPLLGRRELRLEPAVVERGRSYAVHLEDGVVASTGHTLIQARVRALALRAAARGATAPSGNLLHDLIEARLGRAVERPTSLLIVEHAPVPGPPFDPINRGPDRAIGLRSATAVHLHPDRRPSAWRLRPADALRRLVQDALAGFDVEVIPYSQDAQPVAARLSRLATFASQPQPASAAVAAGGEVLLATSGRLRRLPLHRFALRPVACSPDPEAFDLALAPERGPRFQTNLVQRGVLESRTFQISDELGCVLTRDDQGRMLREEVPLDRIEDHLRESRDLLRAGTPPATLAARFSDQLETVLLVHRRQLPRLPVQIGGKLPFGLWVEVEGDRVNVCREGGWQTITQSLMSRIPFGGEFRLGVDRVSVLVGGRAAAPILQLYARSLVFRRLGARLRRELTPVAEPALIDS